jgi:endonuclease YncB( thermonuclease family)
MGEVFRFKRNFHRPAQWQRDYSRRTPGRISRRSRRLPSRWLYRIASLGIVIALFALSSLFEKGALPSFVGKNERATYSATAIDGDSIRTANEEIRLIGIDAPELYQTCRDERGSEWACGREAHSFLRSLVSRGALTCTSNSTDRYGRKLAICSAGPIADVGEAMVRAGYAVNFMEGRYAAAEAEARSAKRGIWRGTFERPQEWRRRTG